MCTATIMPPRGRADCRSPISNRSGARSAAPAGRCDMSRRTPPDPPWVDAILEWRWTWLTAWLALTSADGGPDKALRLFRRDGGTGAFRAPSGLALGGPCDLGRALRMRAGALRVSSVVGRRWFGRSPCCRYDR